jgi:hypothetical protein
MAAESSPSLFDLVDEELESLEMIDRQGKAIKSAARDARTIQERFEEFDRNNPEVYEMLVRYANDMHRRGRTRIGISLLWERMRWEVYLTTDDPDGFKLNNDYRSRYARKIVAEHPSLEGLFSVRKLTAL